ncbi:MAG: ERF family protein [Sulfurimonas sp.]
MTQKMNELTWEKLFRVQQLLKSPKRNHNDFGGYDYRSLEDIMSAVKPLQKELKFVLLFRDEPLLIGKRYYIQATARFIDFENKGEITVSACAREQQERKKMDASQLTGAASSYARKYAANGLFQIDDVKDADSLQPQASQNNNDHSKKPTVEDEISWKKKIILYLGSVEKAQEFIKQQTGKAKITKTEAEKLYKKLVKKDKEVA